MGFAYNNLKRICESLGEHNDALYAVLAIAVFKGVMRPTFTMMDKKSDKETKKYAAFREGLTEAIAFCSYIATHKIFKTLAPVLAKKTGKSEKKIANGLSLFSVCLTAGILIPAICNVTLKPVMDFVKKVNDKKKIKFGNKPEQGKLDIRENAAETNADIGSAAAVYSPKLSPNSRLLMESLYNARMQNYGMKVGG